MNHFTKLVLVFVLVLGSFSSHAFDIKPWLVNGDVVTGDTFKEVIRIKAGKSDCTATIVGPRVFATAGHCMGASTATFEVGGTQYTAQMTKSSLWPGENHDIAVGITSSEIVGVKPATISGSVTQGLGVTLLGYGCTIQGGTIDGKLRMGANAVTGFSEDQYYMITAKPGGAATCSGDSGGPAMLVEGNKHFLLGVNSLGNMVDTNYNTRTDIEASKTFFNQVAQSNSVEICGINKDCSGNIPPPTDPPTCSMSAQPVMVKLGQQVTLSMLTNGSVTEAKINDTAVAHPNGKLVVTASKVGNNIAKGIVTGPGGTGDCGVSFQVEDGQVDPGPTCTLTAVPSQVKVGETIKFTLRTEGNAISANIEGTAVSIPVGSVSMTTATVGTFMATGSVSGPEGSNECGASYEVKDNVGPNPNVPNFSVVPTHCGPNKLPVTPAISSVCLSVIKRDRKLQGMNIGEAIEVRFENGEREVLITLFQKDRPQHPGDKHVKTDVVGYANNVVKTPDDVLVLDTTDAVITKIPESKGLRPFRVEGRAANGTYYIVDDLQPGEYRGKANTWQSE